MGRWRERYGGLRVLWPLYVFGCFSVIVVECACVSDCRELGLWTFGTVD
jgi:hypothetical protein